MKVNIDFLINRIKDDNPELKKQDIELIIKSFLSQIEESLIYEREVNLHGFGKFRIKERESKEYVNPRTGEKINCPPKKFVKFDISKGLRDILC